MTYPAPSVEPGTDKDGLAGKPRLRQSSVTCAECKTKQPPSRKLHDVSYLADKPQVLTWGLSARYETSCNLRDGGCFVLHSAQVTELWRSRGFPASPSLSVPGSTEGAG